MYVIMTYEIKLEEKSKLDNRIRDLRIDHDLSQREVAEAIHTTQQHYSRIELGKTEITGESLKQLAIFYDVSADYILRLTDNPHPTHSLIFGTSFLFISHYTKFCTSRRKYE